MMAKQMEELETMEELLEVLKQAAKQEGIAEDSRFMRRLTSLDIQIMALTLMCRRHDRIMTEILNIRIPEVTRELSTLVLETLGYYGLPSEPGGAGVNEPPIGPEYARRLREWVWCRPDHDAGDETRDLLARRLQGDT